MVVPPPSFDQWVSVSHRLLRRSSRRPGYLRGASGPLDLTSGAQPMLAELLSFQENDNYSYPGREGVEAKSLPDREQVHFHQSDQRGLNPVSQQCLNIRVMSTPTQGHTWLALSNTNYHRPLPSLGIPLANVRCGTTGGKPKPRYQRKCHASRPHPASHYNFAYASRTLT